MSQELRVVIWSTPFSYSIWELLIGVFKGEDLTTADKVAREAF